MDDVWMKTPAMRDQLSFLQRRAVKPSPTLQHVGAIAHFAECGCLPRRQDATRPAARGQISS
eukprot:15298914-Heterocapsa_arctica.AAC.1